MGINVLDDASLDPPSEEKENKLTSKLATVFIGDKVIRQFKFKGNTFSDDTKNYLALRCPKNGQIGDDDLIIYGTNVSVIIEPIDEV